MKNSFQDFLNGAGERMFGNILKRAAGAEKQRINARLKTPNLFPHIEHEDKAALERAEQLRLLGELKIERHAQRAKTIDALKEPCQHASKRPTSGFDCYCDYICNDCGAPL